VICSAIAAVYLTAHFRFPSAARSVDEEAWRRALEFSIVISVYSTFFFNHYYYLIVLAIPLNVLLVRYLTTNARRRLVAWGVAYACLSAFVVPTSVLSRVTGADVWAFYIKGAWFLWGELLLMALLLREYWQLSVAERAASVPLGTAQTNMA
jgi:hypothetical protein